MFLKEENKMNRFSRMLIAAMAVVFLTISCHPMISEYRPEDYSVAPNPTEYNFPAIFKGYWSTMNRNYAFWDIDSTDWDAVYDEYKPKFDALGVFKSIEIGSPAFQLSAATAYSYFKEMSSGIFDGHFRIDFEPTLTSMLGNPDLYKPTNSPMIRFTLDRTRARPGYDERDILFINNNWASSDASNPKQSADGYHEYSFDYFTNIIVSKYFPVGSIWKKGVIPMDVPDLRGTMWPMYESSFRIGTGHISHPGGGYILYLHFSNFGLYAINSGLLDSLAAGLGVTPPNQDFQQGINDVKDAIDQFLIDLTDQNMKGVIVDLRGNYGGDLKDWDILWKRMIDSPLQFANVRAKSGLGRLDYGPWMPFVLDPHTGGDTRVLRDKSIPVVALVDKFTGSAAEMSTLIVKAMPNGHVIGERTMGATSPIGGDNRVFNGGAFFGSKFWTSVNCANLAVRDLEGHINEKIGIPPDQEVGANWDDFLNTSLPNPDNRLNAAIAYIEAH
jgi:hypothetical protein